MKKLFILILLLPCLAWAADYKVVLESVETHYLPGNNVQLSATFHLVDSGVTVYDSQTVYSVELDQGADNLNGTLKTTLKSALRSGITTQITGDTTDTLMDALKNQIIGELQAEGLHD